VKTGPSPVNRVEPGSPGRPFRSLGRTQWEPALRAIARRPRSYVGARSAGDRAPTEIQCWWSPLCGRSRRDCAPTGCVIQAPELGPTGWGLSNLARLARFERATAWFVARYSIQLSYRRVEGRYYKYRCHVRQGLAAQKSVQAPSTPPATAPLAGVSTSTPGFIMPRGSNTALAPANAARNSAGACWS
jgi:hypothetical protein